MTNFAKITLLAIAALGLCSGAFAQMKNNDFTRANKSFNRTFKAENKKASEETHRQSKEKFDAEKFEVRKENQKPREESFRQPDDPAADRYNKQVFEKSGEKREAPERMAFREEWEKEKNSLHMQNKDRILNGNYQGRSDFSKRHPRDAEMRELYEQVQERSMTDINKYAFRSSRTDDPELNISTAGGQIHEDTPSEQSFWDDLIFGKKSAPRTSVSIKKNMDIGVTAPLSGHTASSAQNGTVPKKVMPPVVIGDKQTTSAPQEKKTTVYEAASDKTLMETKDSGLKRGKTIIRVEVGEPKY